MNAAKNKRTHGKKRKPKKPAATAPTKQPAYYETLGQAAAKLGVPKEILTAARKAGAPGFKGPRVYPAELLPWLKENRALLEGDGDKKRTLECRKLELQCEGIALTNRVRADEYIPTAEVDAWQTEKAESLKRILRNKIEIELLPKLTGLMVPEMVPLARAAVTAIVADFRKPLKRKSPTAADPEPDAD